MELKKNGMIKLTAGRMNVSGETVSVIDGKKIVLTGLLEGETAECRILKIGKNVCFAKPEVIISASPGRAESPCLNKGCGACDLLFATYGHQIEIKSRLLSEIFGRETEVLPSGPQRYRNKAVLPIGKVKGGTVIGAYRKNTHDITDFKSSCIVLPAAMNLIINKAKEFLDKNDTAGSAEHLFLRGGPEGYQAGLIVKEVSAGIIAALDALFAADLNIKSVFYSLSSGTNSVMVKDPVFTRGTEFAVLVAKNGIYKLSPGSFFQANITTLDQILDRLEGIFATAPSAKVLDLYSGCGALSNFPGIKRTCVESNAASFQYIQNDTDTSLIASEVSKVPQIITSGGFDIIIADPPRKGIDAQTLKAIDNSDARIFIYLSCDPVTQKRDIADLSNYALIELYGYDMFPGTIHIESLAILKRIEK
jgi:23S rRNA (uracil1939-C5)-methyltransferase